jgi:hypothetical protein
MEAQAGAERETIILELLPLQTMEPQTRGAAEVEGEPTQVLELVDREWLFLNILAPLLFPTQVVASPIRPQLLAAIA